MLSPCDVRPHVRKAFWAKLGPFAVGCLLGLLVSAGRADPSPASSDSAVTVEIVAAGLQGYFKVGDWTPLRISLTSAKPQKVRLLVEANDADDYIAIAQSEHELVQGAQQLETCFRSARMQGDVVVRLESDDGKPLWRQVLRPGASDLHPGLRGDCRVRLTLGRFPKNSNQGGTPTKVSADSLNEELLLNYDSPAALPSEARGYDSAECLTIGTAPLAAGAAPAYLSLTAGQNDALKQWVLDGGHLIVSVGEAVSEFPKSKLAAWLPIVPREPQSLRQLPGLENFLGKNVSLKISGTIAGAALPDLTGPTVLVRELNGPLVVRVPYGFGRVTVIGVDLNQPVFASTQIDRKLAASSRPLLAALGGQATGRLTNLGVSDLATQLMGAQEEFDGVSRTPYWGMMGLLMLYIVVLGPLDYLIVHRLLKRPQLTWVTFPLVVMLAAVGSIWGAARYNGNELRLNQCNLVDVDAASGQERGRSWFTLLSPKTRRYAVDVAPASAGKSSSDLRLTWVGVPENTVGGLYRSGGLNATGRQYHLPAGGRTPDLPVQQWSTKTMIAEWRGNGGQTLAESRLESNGPGRLKGSLVHHLPATLEDCLLVHSGRVYFSDRSRRRLAPGQEWDPTALQGQQRDLRGFLTGAGASRAQGKSGDEIVYTSRVYDPGSSDRLELLRMISFHQAAGGRSYTGLDHSVLSRLELTDLVETGRAVLIGRLSTTGSRGDKSGVNVRVDEQDAVPGARDTFVRIVLPVKQVDTEVQREVPKEIRRER